MARNKNKEISAAPLKKVVPLLPVVAASAKSGALRECLARNRLKVHGKFTDAYVFSLVPKP